MSLTGCFRVSTTFLVPNYAVSRTDGDGVELV